MKSRVETTVRFTVDYVWPDGERMELQTFTDLVEAVDTAHEVQGLEDLRISEGATAVPRRRVEITSTKTTKERMSVSQALQHLATGD